MNQKIIGIIGGTGQMGKWLQRYFSKNGYDVRVAGRKTDLSFEALARQSHIVVLSVPHEAAVGITEAIGPLMNQQQLLMDVCSLKEEIVATMVQATSAQVLGTHPLFGPMTASVKGQNIIFCRGRGNEWADQLEKEFTSCGAIVTHMAPEIHDRHMAVVQGLTHLISICMGRTLQELNMKPDEALLYATPVFRVKLDLIGRLLAQDLELYRNLINKNPYVKTAVDTFAAALEEGGRQIMSDNIDSGTEYLKSIRQFFGDFCPQGYRESNNFIENIYGRKK